MAFAPSLLTVGHVCACVHLFPTDFPLAVPYVAMRGVSAVSGSLLVACVYEVWDHLHVSMYDVIVFVFCCFLLDYD